MLYTRYNVVLPLTYALYKVQCCLTFNICSSLDPDLHHFDLDIQGRSGCEQSQLLTPHLKCQYTIENLLRSLLGSKILKRFWTFQNPQCFRTTFGFSTATNILKCKVTFQNQCQALRTFVIGLIKILDKISLNLLHNGSNDRLVRYKMSPHVLTNKDE